MVLKVFLKYSKKTLILEKLSQNFFNDIKKFFSKSNIQINNINI